MERLYAVLDIGGKVANIIVADQDFVDAHYPGAANITGFDPMPGIGWIRQPDGTFTPPG
jgi:hypothetical protein